MKNNQRPLTPHKLTWMLLRCFLKFLIGGSPVGILQAQNFSHENFARQRGPYLSQVFWNQSVAYDRSVLHLGYSPDSSFNPAQSQPISQNTRGHSIRSELGYESLRFLQTSFVYQTSSLTNLTVSGNGSTHQDLAAHGRLVLYTPVANLLVGGGLGYSRVKLTQLSKVEEFSGANSEVNLQLVRYFSSRVHLFVLASQQTAQLKNRSESSETHSLKLASQKLGAGFGFWF